MFEPSFLITIRICNFFPIRHPSHSQQRPPSLSLLSRPLRLQCLLLSSRYNTQSRELNISHVINCSAGPGRGGAGRGRAARGHRGVCSLRVAAVFFVVSPASFIRFHLAKLAKYARSGLSQLVQHQPAAAAVLLLLLIPDKCSID